MKQELFAELLGSASEALEHARGKRSLRTTILPPPLAPLDGRDVKRIRARLRASQGVFARYLNVSTKLVQAWEGGRRTPDGAALLLLHLAEREPSVVERLHQGPTTRRTPRAARRHTTRTR